MKSKGKRLNIIVISIMVFSMLLYSCGKKPQNEPSPLISESSSEITEVDSSSIPIPMAPNGEVPPPATSESQGASSSQNENASNNTTKKPSNNLSNNNQNKTPSKDIVINDNTNGDIITLDGVRGVWVSTAWNIDFPSEYGLSKAKLINEINTIVNNCKSLKLNAIFLQVRPESDALYNSKIFPTSRFLTTRQGASLVENFDPLTYFISYAHKNGIALHAWINPFRASVTKLSLLCDSHPLKKNPDLWLPTKCSGEDGCYDINCKNQKMLFYDPAKPEVRKLVIDGVAELVDNYDIDGIHLDDYFYPDKQAYPYNDDESYNLYSKGQSRDDFRRSNTYKLIKDINSTVNNHNSKVAFGVSPGGIWADKSTNPNGSDTINSYESYNEVYADTRLWVKDRILDYIAPQIYFSGTNPRVSFDVLSSWWSDVVEGTGVGLLIGHAAYKTVPGVYDYFPSSEIGRQLNFCNTLKNFNGSIFFSYANLNQIKNDLIY
ncbi:MAG: family 10 glycosylhydrolase [Clostridia bacterium]